MAQRPAWTIKEECIRMVNFEFKWNGGFAISQKQKNIFNLHKAIYDIHFKSALEISTKSNNELGISLSAFNLKLDEAFVENVFQASKMYENGGLHVDLIKMEPKNAKRDLRHKSSGTLIGFKYSNHMWK